MKVRRGGTSILLVEDDLASSSALAEILAGAGYTVVTAASGREALERLRELPDLGLVLLDLLIPDGDGFQLLERRRQGPQLARVPIIAMSGLEQPVDAYAQLRKPINVERLLKLIRPILAPKAAASDGASD